MNLRKEQEEILKYEKGKLAIPAVPGAGKTFVLTHLAVKLLKKNEDKNILILTYMNSAVENFKSKILKLISEENINAKNRFEVMTIHSLAMKIVQELYPSEELNIADDVTKSQLIRMVVDEWRSENDSKQFIESLIDNEYKEKKIKNMFVEDKFLEDICTIFFRIIPDIKYNLYFKIDISNSHKILKFFLDLYQRYDNKLKRKNLIDFDDMLIRAYDILKNENKIKIKYQEKYYYIFEDEAQDSNIIQNKILDILSEKNGNLVKVGDSNQSILSTFTSADPHLFREFCKKENDKKVLFKAGRSSKDIINIANYFVKKIINDSNITKGAFEEQYISPVEEGEHPKNPITEKYGVYFSESKSWEEELEEIVKIIKKITSCKDWKEKTLALLVPNNFQIEDITKKLETEKIMYEEFSDISKENLNFLIKFGSIVEFAGNPSNKETFLLLLNYLLETKDEKQKFEIENIIKKNNLIEIFFHKGLDLNLFKNINNNIYDIIEKLKKIIQFPKNSYEEFILYVGDVLGCKDEQKAIVQKIAASVKTLFYLNPKWTLSDLGKEIKNVKNNRFSFFLKSIQNVKGKKVDKGIVTVTTYHKSKGLEWDYVILSGVSNENFPASLSHKIKGEYEYLKEEYKFLSALLKTLLNNKQNSNYIEETKKDIICERARLLYVGITRAKEYLFITTTKTKEKNEKNYYFNLLKEIAEQEKKKKENE